MRFMLWLMAIIAPVMWLAPPFEAREHRVQVEPRPYPILCCGGANCDLVRQVIEKP
jgi:hypothetical protein